MSEVTKIVIDVKESLLKDLPIFLKLEQNKKYFLGEKIDSYCSIALEQLVGKAQLTPNFSIFINVLYGCQQLDEFGEQWAPTKEKIETWIVFLKKFKV